jgi:hypothetical protein
MTIKASRAGSGYAYRINGVRAPGVTKITGMLPSQNLIDWAANATADYAVNHWAELSELPWATRLNTLRRSRYLTTNPAKNRGIEVHKLAEADIWGESDESVPMPEELRGYVEAYRDFLRVMTPKPVATELVVANKKLRYCGRTDLIADLPDLWWDGDVIPACRWMLDLKTGEKGVYAEAALQLCGYQHADTFAANDGQEPDERPMSWLQVERCGVVHLSSDAWELRPVDTGKDTWTAFRYLLWLYRQQESESMRGWVGSPITEAVDLAATP